MNANISALPPAPSLGAFNPIPAAAPQSQRVPEPSFSRALDRAAQPGRPRGSARLNRPPNDSAPTPKRDESTSGFHAEPKPAPPVQNQKETRDETEALAGALAVAAAPPAIDLTPPATSDSLEITTAAAASIAVTTDQATQSSLPTSATTPIKIAVTEIPANLLSESADEPAAPLPATRVRTQAAAASEPAVLAAEQTTERSSPTKGTRSDLRAITTPTVTQPVSTTSTPAPKTEGLNAASSEPGPASIGTWNTLLVESATAPATKSPMPEEAAILPSSAAGSADSDAPRPVARAARRVQVDSPETPAGTGGAKSNETMKTANKKEELAGSSQQLLPSVPAGGIAMQRNLPGSRDRGNRPQPSALDALDGAGKVLPAPTRADLSTPSEELTGRANTTMARVSEVVAREIRMFRRGGDDLVEVVLTPDTKTQISLRLQWREGQVEVQARCDLGDYQSLNTKWPQLQTSLADQGVRLSHLSERVTTGLTEFFSNSNFNPPQNRDRQPDHSVAVPEPLPPPAPVRTTAAPAVRRDPGHLEYWA